MICGLHFSEDTHAPLQWTCPSIPGSAVAVRNPCRAAFAGITVFRWDINIRESTVLGLVGAGGIGLELAHSLNTIAWPQVSLIFLVILVTVIVSEWVSARVRHSMI